MFSPARNWANQELIARVLRIVQQRGEAVDIANDPASEDVAEEIGADS